MLSDKELQELGEESKKILDKFGFSLTNVQEPEDVDLKVISYRKEENGKNCEKDFKKRLFENAPKHNDDCIIAEKGEWK